MQTEITFWNNPQENYAIRKLVLEQQLYESTYGNSRFKRFAELGDRYTNGFSILLYDSGQNIVGILLAERVDNLVMPGGIRKRTRDYGFSGKLIETQEHSFRVLADVGMYIKSEHRGNNYSKILLNALESQILPKIFIRNAEFNDIPVFSFHSPLYEIAEKCLTYSRPVKHAFDSSGLREELHYWSILEKPINKYDPFPMKPPILHWSSIKEELELQCNVKPSLI